MPRSKQLTRDGGGVIRRAPDSLLEKEKVPSRDRLLSGLVFTVFIRKKKKKKVSLHGLLVIKQHWRQDVPVCVCLCVSEQVRANEKRRRRRRVVYSNTVSSSVNVWL